MASADYTIITNATHPAYSEECDSYLDPGNAKALRLFMKGSPSPRKGVAAFYCLTKSGFSGIEGDSVSLRLSFQNHYDSTNNTKPGDIGLFAFADKARLQAMADENSTAANTGYDVMLDDLQGIAVTSDRIHSEYDSLHTIGRNEGDGNALPATLGSNADFAVANIGDFMHIRWDITIYNDGVKKMKIKSWRSRKNIAYPANEAAWDDANNFITSEKTHTHQHTFDYNNNGVMGETSWNSGDPIEGSLTNSAGAATEAVSGFFWRNGDRGSTGSSDQDDCPQVTIGHFEMRIKSDTV